MRVGGWGVLCSSLASVGVSLRHGHIVVRGSPYEENICKLIFHRNFIR